MATKKSAANGWWWNATATDPVIASALAVLAKRYPALKAKKAPGAERIYSAGEKEYEIWKSREPSGVPINESVQGEINAVRDELGLDYTFPWEEGYKPYPETKKITAHIENL